MVGGAGRYFRVVLRLRGREGGAGEYGCFWGGWAFGRRLGFEVLGKGNGRGWGDKGGRGMVGIQGGGGRRGRRGLIFPASSR